MEKIIGLYKEALNSIAPQEFIHTRAVINELIGEFWLSHNEELICKTYIKEAYYYYSQWGAYSKVIMLEKKYSQFFTSVFFNNALSKRSTSLHTDAIALDIMSILKSSEAISSEIRLEKLLKVLMNTIIENAGAQNGCLILKNVQDGKLYIEAIKSRDSEDIKLMNSTSLHQCNDFCPEIVQYVIRTRENMVIENALNNPDFQNNEYIHKMNLKSILCIPIIYENDLHGIIYLENNLTENLFSATRIEILKILSSQIAVSIEKAQLYEKLEDKVNERTKELELVNKELKELSLHDPLTKLHNRRYIYEYVEGLSENFIKEKCVAFFNNQKRDSSVNANVIGIFMLDIDHFKKVNDTYGHNIGDEALKAITNTLKSLIRNEDFFVRWGGEEFLIILNRTKFDYLKLFAEKILKGVKATDIKLKNGDAINITCSIGCAYLPFEPSIPDFFTLEQVISISDFALYKAKENGRNCSAHIKLNNKEQIKREELKKFLTALSNDSIVNEKFFKIDYINPGV